MASASLSLQGPVQPKLTDMAAPDEQTPLLETNGAAETPKSQRKPSSSDDEESSHGSSDSKDRDDLKSSAGLLGIILVLVLGELIHTDVELPWMPMPYILLYRCLHRQCRWLDRCRDVRDHHIRD